MFTHEQIWEAIDRLAQSAGYSTSGLAKQAGLDPTSFNKSKRLSADGKPRWPSTESLAKILNVTNLNMTEFITYIELHEVEAPQRNIPITQLTIETDVFAPYYRRGDLVGLSENATIKSGERVVLQVKSGGILIANYIAHGHGKLRLQNFIHDNKEQTISLDQIQWFSRIMWVKH